MKITKHIAFAAAFLAALFFYGCPRHARDGLPNGRMLSIAIAEPPNTADPAAVLDVGSAYLLNAIHAPLSVVDPQGHLVMVLADSITMSPDAMRCDIILKSAKFWDGSPVTAADVQYSFERVRGSTHPHRWIFDRVAGVDGFDQKTSPHLGGIEFSGVRALTISFTKPEPDFPLLISSGLTAIVKSGSDKSPKQPFDQQVIGAGAWRPLHFDPGASFALEPNPGFPVPTNAQRLTLVIESNPQNQIEGFVKARFQAIRLRGPMLSETCAASATGPTLNGQFAAARLVRSHANELIFLKWNWNSAELKDIAASERQGFLAAVSSSIRRDELARVLYLGAAVPSTIVVPPSTVGSESVDALPAVSSVTGRRTISLLSPNDPSSRALAGYLQNQLHDLGINLEITFVDLGSLVQRMLKGEYTVSLLWIEQQIPSTGCFAWAAFWTPGSPFTAFGENLTSLTDEAATARSIIDPADRRAAYTRLAADITIHQTAWTPLLSRDAVFLESMECDGLFVDVNGFPYFQFLRIRGDHN